MQVSTPCYSLPLDDRDGRRLEDILLNGLAALHVQVDVLLVGKGPHLDEISGRWSSRCVGAQNRVLRQE